MVITIEKATLGAFVECIISTDFHIKIGANGTIQSSRQNYFLKNITEALALT